MRSKSLLALLGMVALMWIPGDIAHGQRGGRGGGRGGGFGGGRAGGGQVVGTYSGGGAGYRSSGTVVGPAGGSRSYGSGTGSYTTQRGTTINYGGAGQTATGPGGVTAGRGVGGVQVTTPGGQTGTKVGTVGGIQGPGGYGAVSGRSVGGTTGPYGTGVSASRGGAAIGPYGAAAGGTRVGTAVGPGGRTVSGASHWGAATNPYAAYGSASRGIAVTGAAGHYTSYRSAAALRTQGGYVRTGFTAYHYFNPAWYTAHPGAWRAAAWTAAAYWRWASYATVATFCDYPAEPVIYDYGADLVYEDNRVFYNGEPVATAEEYATQASDLAVTGQAAKPAEEEEWQPLGVFAMVQGDEKEANNIFQIAINKDGVLRGNYYNGLTDTTLPIYGSVDKKSQRAAWIIGDKKDTVYETGVGNLSQPETTMLVHIGKDRTQQWTLVRLEERNPQAAKDVTAPEGVARITVIVPADAEVFFDGNPTKQTGTQRVFDSPPLKPGSRYTYSVRARWTADGRPVDQTRSVPVRAGAQIRVDFTSPLP